MRERDTLRQESDVSYLRNPHLFLAATAYLADKLKFLAVKPKKHDYFDNHFFSDIKNYSTYIQALLKEEAPRSKHNGFRYSAILTAEMRQNEINQLTSSWFNRGGWTYLRVFIRPENPPNVIEINGVYYDYYLFCPHEPRQKRSVIKFKELYDWTQINRKRSY